MFRIEHLRLSSFSNSENNLSGVAITLVPKCTVPTIDEAWDILEKFYGDAYRIIKYRKDELLKVGKFQRVNERGQGGYS